MVSINDGIDLTWHDLTSDSHPCSNLQAKNMHLKHWQRPQLSTSGTIMLEPITTSTYQQQPISQDSWVSKVTRLQVVQQRSWVWFPTVTDFSLFHSIQTDHGATEASNSISIQTLSLRVIIQ
jgi:hypothetical protein